MLTKEKVQLFQLYKGYLDGYLFQNAGNDTIINGEEWSLLAKYMQDLFLIRNGRASKQFEVTVLENLTKDSDTQDTASLIIEVEKQLNGLI